ncbi:hypothetical protein BKA01_001231 [Pseudonocardia eucalypti]|nr:hypothetical protein [Pseudonocardia eucalypti]
MPMLKTLFRRTAGKVALAVTAAITLTVLGVGLDGRSDQAFADLPIDVDPNIPIIIPELGDLPLGPTPIGAKGAHRPVPKQRGCTRKITPAEADAAVKAAKSGDKLCVVGGSTTPIDVVRPSAGPSPLITLTGDGSPIKGVYIDVDNIVVENFNSIDAEAPGFVIEGKNITMRNNVIDNPKEGDNDGLRFFGSHLRILNNTIKNARNTDDAHADCMQTYSDDSPPSDHVVIDNNRCEGIDNQCLIIEGPNDGEGDGVGHTEHIIFSRNYCEATGGEIGAYQAVMLEDVQHMTIALNDIRGPIRKAFAFDIGSTHGRVLANRIDPRIPCKVGMDETSKPGYIGPRPTCAP